MPTSRFVRHLQKNRKPYLDAAELSLAEWLRLLEPHPRERPYLFVDYCFPTDQHRQEYLASIATRPDREVKDLLRNFLMLGGGLVSDYNTMDSLSRSGRLLEAIQTIEHVKRLYNSKRHPWEGNTWVLDLLPDSPQRAIDALDAYISAHMQFLPDGRWDGLEDAIAVIREKYLEVVHPEDSLLAISPRDFELLIATLYSRMGYDVQLTRATRDGGYDVGAVRSELGQSENILIECKRYARPVRVDVVRALSGVVHRLGATKGILITTSTFTQDARREAKECRRIELVDYRGLNKLLNRVFGSEWPAQIAFHVRMAHRSLSEDLRLESELQDEILEASLR